MSDEAKIKALETKCDRLAQLAQAEADLEKKAALYDRMHKTAESMKKYF